MRSEGSGHAIAAATVRVAVPDDGIGFDIEAARAAGGLGLRSVLERVTRLGGSLDLVSTPGSGTRLTVEVPL
jgi:two-component system, NarL family, sensor histidine kinase LiaS